MIRQTEEDYFKESTMTFGEHLEELRGSLFRAVIGLVIGTLIGLIFGKQVVELIQYPLKEALVRYYQHSSMLDLEKFQKDHPNEVKLSPKDLKEELVRDRQVSKVQKVSDSASKNAVIVDRYALAQQRFQRLAAEQYLKNRDLYTPESFPNLTPELAEQAKKRHELTEAELEKFNLALLQIAYPDQAENRERVYLQRIDADEHEPLKIRSFNVQESFMIYLKASLLFGAVISSPWVFYQLWLFVSAGLYPHEKKYVNTFLPLSLFLFMSGAAIAFFFVFSFVLDYLLDFNRWLGIDPDPRINEWLGTALMLPLGFGISFQLPLLMLFLERIGIMSVNTYLEKWRIVVLVIFIVSAILTPADPYSMLFMALPLCLLFFVGIGLCHWWPKQKRTHEIIPA